MISYHFVAIELESVSLDCRSLTDQSVVNMCLLRVKSEEIMDDVAAAWLASQRTNLMANLPSIKRESAFGMQHVSSLKWLIMQHA